MSLSRSTRYTSCCCRTAWLPCHRPPMDASEHCCLSKTFWLSSLIASSLFSSADSVLAPQDHPAVLTAFYLKEDAGPISITDELLHSSGRIRVRAIMKYLLFKKGPLASTGCDHGAFVSTNGASLTQLYSSLNP